MTIRAAVAVRVVEAVLQFDGDVVIGRRNYALIIGETARRQRQIVGTGSLTPGGGPGVRPVESSEKDSGYRESCSGRDGGCLDRDHESRRKSR